jgi:endo-1,4-beta-mannosidase
MKLLITTQVYENYAWREDGTLGVGDDAYWKAKGGRDYVVKNFRGDDTIAVMAVRGQIETENDGYREHIVDWSIVADDYLTQFERDQLEYDGSIMFPAQELELA